MKKLEVQNSVGQQEVEKAKEQFDHFDKEIQSMTLDRMNLTKRPETESSLKVSQQELERSNGLYLKPIKSIGCRDKFNERFRAAYEYDKEYVNFTAKHNELIGEEIEIWTRPYGGMPAEEWKVPTNKPVWGPRYLAEQIKRKFHHRLVMTENTHSSTGVGQFYGSMAADTTIQRLDAHPVSQRKSVFMGSNSF
jgi:hypothetical protein